VQDDLDRLEAVETVEELKDVYQHFLLYHGRQLPASQEFHRKKVPSSLPRGN
jgi:transcription elongation factor SPT6